jgi:hypothetical protein
VQDSLAVRADLERIANAKLKPGEQLLWVGKPYPARVGCQFVPVSCMAVPWTLFALYWMAAASGIVGRHAGLPGPVNFIMPLFGLPFVFLGFAMFSAPYRAARKARSTVYAITDKRTMVITAGRSRSVRSYKRGDMKAFECTVRADGSGDLVFARRSSSTGGPWDISSTSVGFYGIPEVRVVEKLMRDTFKKETG